MKIVPAIAAVAALIALGIFLALPKLRPKPEPQQVETAEEKATQDDWKMVRNKLIRLRSGIDRESIMALRSTLAETDAAMKIYSEDDAEHVYEPGFLAAQRAISYLGLAIDHPRVTGGNQKGYVPLGVEIHRGGDELVGPSGQYGWPVYRCGADGNVNVPVDSLDYPMLQMVETLLDFAIETDNKPLDPASHIRLYDRRPCSEQIAAEHSQ